MTNNQNKNCKNSTGDKNMNREMNKNTNKNMNKSTEKNTNKNDKGSNGYHSEADNKETDRY